MAGLLQQPILPTAFLCYNDLTAIGAMGAARQAGLRVPDDLSIMGYDDIAQASYVVPALTTIRQRMSEMGDRAAGMALRLLDGEQAVEDILVPVELVERESCAAPAA